ncbi:MAG: GMC family oxidoreductase [Myxococcales bacterium]
MAVNGKSTGRVVVVGTGPAGAAAALFLSKAGIETLMLEVGSEQAELGFTARVKGFTFAKRRPPLRQRPDFKRIGDPESELYEELAPGGLSNQWSCAVPRFAEEDFLDAKRGGEVHTWPIGYADVAPWYDKVEPLLHVAAGDKDAPRLPRSRAQALWKLGRDWDAVSDAAEPLGRSVVVMPYANGKSTMFTRSATAFNAFSQLVLPAVRAGELSIRYDARVLRLEWSASERRVTAVVYRDAKSGREERVECRAVVVAAGAVNSAQILLQSESADFPKGLGNQHDVLGRYLHDHPLGKLVIDLPRPVSVHPASYITRPPLERSEPLYAAAYMQWCGAPTLVRSALKGTPGRLKQIGFSVFGTMAPSPDDYVALDPERAKNGSGSSVVVSLRHPPEAVKTLERARDEMMDILKRAGWDPQLSVWKVEAPGNSVHYGGTCRMHASPRFGVVDAFSRVHGVPNVVVADSSVFTTGPEKNPVLTSMALAARAGDRLAQELKQGDL